MLILMKLINNIVTMNKKRIIGLCILLFVSVLVFSVYFSTEMKNEKLSNIMLANVEALAQDEYNYENGSAEKIVNTYDSDPTYTISPDGEKIIENIIVCTETTCYGSGIIKCEYDFSMDLATRVLNP